MSEQTEPVRPDMSRRRARVLLLATLVAGAWLRWTGVAWDQGHHLHPDERYISMVEDNLEFPRSVGQYFDSATSPLNPYNRQHDSFVYGTLPMILTKVVADRIGKPHYDGAYLVGRALSGFFDLVTVWLAYRLGRRLSSRRAGLIAAAFIAFCPLGIQLSHFWGVDSFLTTFATATLLGCVRISQGRASWKSVALTAAALGLAVSCKITALALLAPLGIAILVSALDSAPRPRRWGPLARVVALRSALAAAVAFVTIRVALPYVFLGWKLDPRYLKDMHALMSLGQGVAGFPPALQWAGRTPFFPLENFLLWGAAPFFGLAAIAGAVAAAFAAWRLRRRDLLPLLAFAAVICAYHALTLSKSIRYFYPAYPALAVLGGVWLASLSASAARAASRRRRMFLRALPAVAVAGTVLAGLAFSAIYRRPVTRHTASDWIYAHVPPGNRFSTESWDDGLPFPTPGYDGEAYHGPSMDLWGPDNPAKADAMLRTLAGCEWIAITSNRVYGSITRVPSVFPMTTAYYRALFEGRLGFERAADFTSYPRLGPLQIPDDRSEETFTVYDHPRVLLFRKTADYSEPRARAILYAALSTIPPTIWDWEKAPRSQRRVARSIVPSRGPATVVSSGGSRLEGGGGSWKAAIVFYLATALVGLLALPLVTFLFANLRDRGAGIARVVGLIVATYVLTVLVQGRALGNGRGAALAGLFVLALLSGALFVKRRDEMMTFWRGNWRRLAEGEVVFFAGFVLFTALRALNPEIYWGEKPMDFSILNILVRTPTLPASDPWFAGAPLGYYTFGQEMVALLSMLTGISTRYTFNLAFGLLGGALLAGAYSLGRNWAGTRRAGVAAAVLVGIAGNLAGLREWIIKQPAAHQARHLDWHYFWATSRVISGTIQEFPFWSLTFADLHAHVFAFPIFLVVVTCALSLVRRHADPRPRLLPLAMSAAVLGAAISAQALTNAWDVPLLAGLTVLVAIVCAFASGRLRFGGVLRAAGTLVVSAAVSVVLVLPLWVRGGGAPGHGRNGEAGASGADILTHFGLFVFLALAWWLVTLARRMLRRSRRPSVVIGGIVLLGLVLAVLAFQKPDAFYAAGIVLFLVAAVAFRGDPEDRLACGFVATAFFLILFTQRYYIYDRMNTFFKLYLEAWLLLAIAVTALAFGRWERPGSLARWPLVLKGAFLVLLGAAFFTTVSDARGAVSPNRASLPDGVHPYGWTLDGLRYRELWHPGEYRAVVWLRSEVAGTPVVLEAQGPTYQEFGRISMLTGLPTVLGWDYHVLQRGNPATEIDARREAVKKIYSSPKGAEVEDLLRRYHVGYVYVGALERNTYPIGGLKKFDADASLFQKAYENPDVSIYRVVGGDTEDVVLPTRELLPEPSPETVAAAQPRPSEPEELPKIAAEADQGGAPWPNLREPRGAAVDGKHRVWIADFGHSRLRVYDAKGGFLGGWGGRGSGEHGFNELCAVAVGGNNLYVADTWNGRVQAFDLQGVWKASATELYGPRGVAVGPDGRVWVSDTGNGRVMRYDANLTHGSVIGKKGPEKNAFDGPVGLAVGPSGSVYVADVNNKRIQVLDPDGGFYRSFPVLAWASGSEPSVAVGPDEMVYVSDPPGNAVLEFTFEGRLTRRLVADGAGKAFAAPTGLALDRETRILYVINSSASTVTTISLQERK